MGCCSDRELSHGRTSLLMAGLSIWTGLIRIELVQMSLMLRLLLLVEAPEAHWSSGVEAWLFVDRIELVESICISLVSCPSSKWYRQVVGDDDESRRNRGRADQYRLARFGVYGFNSGT